MTAPPHTLNFNPVSQSDTNNYRSLTPRSSAISPGRENGLPNSTSDDTARRTSSYDPDTDFAYGANPIPDTAFCSPDHASSSASSTHDADTTAGVPLGLASSYTNAATVPNLNLASFGSQPWPTTSAPYLDFAPRPIYEPTGELVHEAVEGFDQFDDPSSLQQTHWTSEQAADVAETQQATSGPGFTVPPVSAASGTQHFRKPALKRPVDSDGGDTQREGNRPPTADPRKLRKVSFEQMSATGPTSADDEDSSSSEGPSTTRPVAQGRLGNTPRRGRGSRAANLPPSRSTAQQTSGARASATVGGGNKTPTAHPPSILPPEKVFPIQIGSELFRLSGASISSDAPSYFTQFFEEQVRQNEESGGVRTLYIDRDPETFQDVARHLQGYYVKPRDGSHFVKLFADAQFYSLPRLIDQLFEAEIFIQIGEQHFQIPKDIFSDPGNSPNFFSLGFAVFFSSPGEVFPGLDRRGLLRPPSITPPYVPGRSAETFAQLLHLLRGYPLRIENEDHRAELLRDCRYFHLRGLEQKVIAHEISYNLVRQQNEMCLRIEDIKPSGISYKADEAENDQDVTGGWVRYARPFVDDGSFELIVEVGGETTILDLNDMRADFHGLAKARVSSLFQVVANKMNLPTNAPLGAMLLSGVGQSSHASPGHTPLSEDRVKVRFEHASDILLDGAKYDIDWESSLGQYMAHGPSRSVDDSDDSDAMEEDRPTETQAPQRSRARTGQRDQTQQSSSRGTVTGAPPPRIDTTTNTSRKRRRPTLSSSAASGHGEWVIRRGQWRLRVQQNEQDSIRGGYEIVFIAVKLDAFSHERARNARRSFLGGG
ncbi:hypothetical protein OHC33_008339 [Knufia fluminis]|uniref:Potassium channel tetramerisation-type BTB domain-containing protein n=1 Tax=Knufia fluminis TaxID=191047 RepID=A0AAN8I262_9EURO|nr:hypothetical protein OHC33_008339 [Knufia fluminis]